MNERREEILNRFKKSWEETELSYDDLIKNHPGWERVEPIREYISILKKDKNYLHFRLGTSMHALIISRSVNFGLRPDQKYIKIEAIDLNDFEVALRDGDNTYRQYRMKSLDDIRLSKLLKTLKTTLID